MTKSCKKPYFTRKPISWRDPSGGSLRDTNNSWPRSSTTKSRSEKMVSNEIYRSFFKGAARSTRDLVAELNGFLGHLQILSVISVSDMILLPLAFASLFAYSFGQPYSKCSYGLLNTSSQTATACKPLIHQQMKVYHGSIHPRGTLVTMLRSMQQARTARGRYSKLSASVKLTTSRSMCRRGSLRSLSSKQTRAKQPCSK